MAWVKAAVAMAGVGWCACQGDRPAAATPAQQLVQTAQAAAPNANSPAAPEGGKVAPAPQAADAISMVFVGDIMFGRYKGNGFVPIAAEQTDIFADVAPKLVSDFTLANLETPAMWTPPTKSPYDAHLRFVTTPARIAALKRAGIGHVTVANNHHWDMKAQGVTETPLVLAAEGVQIYGEATTSDNLFAVKPVDVNGWKVGVLAAATLRNYKQRDGEPRLPWADGAAIQPALVPVIQAAAADYDLLIVTLHWGAEYRDAPADWQIKAARAFIDAGADAVIGHHPHVLQGMELYKGRPIAYSLGNFVFDNVRHPLQQSAILRLTFKRQGNCMAKATVSPVQVVRGPFRPTLALGPKAVAVRKRLTTLSAAKPLSTTWSQVQGGEDLQLELANCPLN